MAEDAKTELFQQLGFGHGQNKVYVRLDECPIEPHVAGATDWMFIERLDGGWDCEMSFSTPFHAQAARSYFHRCGYEIIEE